MLTWNPRSGSVSCLVNPGNRSRASRDMESRVPNGEHGTRETSWTGFQENPYNWFWKRGFHAHQSNSMPKSVGL